MEIMDHYGNLFLLKKSEKIMLEINLTKNTNDAIQGTSGKYYGRVEYKGTLGVKDLAKLMKKHTTAFSLGEITGMLLDLAALIKEYALMGYVV